MSTHLIGIVVPRGIFHSTLVTWRRQAMNAGMLTDPMNNGEERFVLPVTQPFTLDDVNETSFITHAKKKVEYYFDGKRLYIFSVSAGKKRDVDDNFLSKNFVVNVGSSSVDEGKNNGIIGPLDHIRLALQNLVNGGTKDQWLASIPLAEYGGDGDSENQIGSRLNSALGNISRQAKSRVTSHGFYATIDMIQLVAV